ncbi:MAG: UPF0149 family protein [Thiotrichaceae bacterium]|nr:UPF0149 family protein [Thiotrichaceae bacterium]
MDYIEIEALLMRTDCQYTPAEVQGISCGMLAVDLNSPMILWIKHIFEDYDEQNVLHQDKKHELKVFWNDSRTQMLDGNLSFALLLPDDEESLEDRVDAMQEWAEGFLMGIALAGVQDMDQLPTNSKELIDDFLSISKEKQLDMSNDEESEEAYLQIVEYLRMGTILIMDECQPEE